MTQSNCLPSSTYNVLFVSGQKAVTFRKGRLVDKALLCASQINTKVLQEECNMGEKLENIQKRHFHTLITDKTFLAKYLAHLNFLLLDGSQHKQH